MKKRRFFPHGHLTEFGCVSSIKTVKGITATVEMESLEIHRILEGIEAWLLWKNRPSDREALKAVRVLLKKIQTGGELRFTADVVMAQFGFRVAPIFPTKEEREEMRPGKR